MVFYRGCMSASLYLGPFFESSLLPWQGYTVSVIRNSLFFIGCFFITSRSFSKNTRAGLSESMASCVPSSRMLLRSISTAAIRCAGLPASGVQAVGESASSCFPARHAVSVLHVMPSAVRSGVSGCGRNFFWMSRTARSSSPSLRCCGCSSVIREPSFLHYLWQPSMPC